jgi:hypothetical protein
VGKGGEDGAALADTGISPENKQQKSGVLSIEMGRLLSFPLCSKTERMLLKHSLRKKEVDELFSVFQCRPVD